VPLSGLAEFDVVVENLSPDLAGMLTRDTLVTDVELRLRQAGIRLNSDAREYLYVHVSAVPGTKLASGLFAFDITMRFMQPVYLARNRQWTMASTWHSKGQMRIVGRDNFSEYVRGTVRDEVDQFIKVYLAANPKTR
jgi:hypothetical protein